MITVTYDVQGNFDLEPMRLILDPKQDLFTIENPEEINFVSAMNSVFSVTADGIELDYIADNFDCIPWHDNRETIRWRGEVGGFILDNITILRPNKFKISKTR